MKPHNGEFYFQIDSFVNVCSVVFFGLLYGEHFIRLCCGLYSICIWPTPIYVDKSKRRVAVK